MTIHTVIFPTFHFVNEVNICLGKKKRQGKVVIPTQLQEWLDSVPHTAKSVNGKDLMFHLPNMLRKTSHVSCYILIGDGQLIVVKKQLFDALMLFAKVAKVSVKAGTDANCHELEYFHFITTILTSIMDLSVISLQIIFSYPFRTA